MAVMGSRYPSLQDGKCAHIAPIQSAMAIDSPFYFDNALFAQRLKSGRRKTGLTLDQLSKLTKLIDPKQEGISRVALSRYETEASLPGLRELRLLSFSLRLPLAWLVYEEHMDPMLNYRTSLQMRVTEMAFDTEIASGVIKTSIENEPEKDPKYLDLLGQVRDEETPADEPPEAPRS
jgi:transcriptional regulator with XRE-family HTH domain